MLREKLFNLIQSLSASEKKLFHQHAHRHITGSDTLYLRAFEVLSKMKEYDEPRLRTELGIKDSDKNFHKLKSYLYHLILKVLAINRQQDSPHAQFLELFGTVEVLTEKQMFAEALEQTMKAREIVSKDPEFIEMLLATYRWEEMINSVSQAGGIKLEAIEENFNQRLQIIAHLVDFIQIRLLFFKYRDLTMHGVLKAEDQQQLFALFSHPLINRPTEPESPATHRLYYILKFIQYQFNGDIKGSLEYRKKTVEKIATYPQDFFFNEWMLIYSTFTYIQGLVENGDFETAFQRLDQLAAMSPKSQHNRHYHYLFVFAGKFLVYKSLGKIDACLQLIKDYSLHLNDYIKGVHLIHEYRNIQSIINFLIGIRHYEDAIRFIQPLLNDKLAEENASAFYIHARFMNIIAHYELGNYDLLESLIRQTDFYFTSRNIQLNFGNVLLKAFRQLEKPDLSIKEVCRNLWNQLRLLQTYPVERIHIIGFLESGWLQHHGVKIELAPQPVFM
jgi:hypothetical protein